MLSLDDPRWRSLSHAYGEASDIPGLLRQLETAAAPEQYRSEPWFSLWSALCHQSDVYLASYAAVPHFVRLCQGASQGGRIELLHLVAWIEACRHRSAAPPIPEDLAGAYHDAIARLPALIATCFEQVWDDGTSRILAGALVIAKGNPRLGMAILDFDTEIQCPECDAVFATPGYDLDE
jgi:hypothetical protein